MSARTLELRVMRLTGNDENGEEIWSEPEVLESGTDYQALSRRLKELSDEANEAGRGYAVVYWITPKPPARKERLNEVAIRTGGEVFPEIIEEVKAFEATHPEEIEIPADLNYEALKRGTENV